MMLLAILQCMHSLRVYCRVYTLGATDNFVLLRCSAGTFALSVSGVRLFRLKMNPLISTTSWSAPRC